jgi:coenzyme F420-reducing hydrogenase gamma subunit
MRWSKSSPLSVAIGADLTVVGCNPSRNSFHAATASRLKGTVAHGLHNILDSFMDVWAPDWPGQQSI